MTYRTKNTAIVFAFVAMLMAAPLAYSNAYAETGDGEIDGACSVTIPSNIDLGNITPGAVQDEALVSFDTTGTIAGSFEITSDTDWDGLGSKATGSLLITGDNTGDTITINGQGLLGVTGGSPGVGEFDTDGGSNALQAAALATAINADGQAGGEDVGTGISVTAYATGNAVLLTSTIRGTSTNGVLAVGTSDAGTADIVTATLGGGAAADTHINSEDVKYAIVTNGGVAPESSYATKTTTLGATGVNVVLSTTTDPNETVDVYFHFNGVDTAATGNIEVLSTLANNDDITVGGTTFTAKSANPDASNNEFLVTGTENTDALALKAAIDAVPNDPDVITGTVSGADLPLTAARAGTPGNSVALSQVENGFTLTTFSGGDDAIEALPYDGPIAATMTFTADCE